MPDIPLDIVGNAQGFSITIPKGDGPRNFEVDSVGEGKLTLDPKVTSLQLIVTNGQGLSVIQPLGTGWRVRIEQSADLNPKEQPRPNPEVP
jgi:hypothetical protein